MTCVLLSWLFSPSVLPAEDQTGTASPHAPSRYAITTIHRPKGPGGFQSAVSRGYYTVNFGSREGVMKGSIFNVYSKETLMGVVRVDQVWRDSAAVSLIELAHKPSSHSPNPLERGYYLKPKFVFLETILFDKGEPDLSPAMYERLHYDVRFIRTFPDFPLILEGHTDATGKAAENQKLSEARAERIKTFLHEVHRLPLSQMVVKGYGETDPIATNATEEGRRQNRRVDLILTDERFE